MEDLSNTKKCYYHRGNTDCSEWQADRVNEQLDYCDNCSRYYSCRDVAYLNDRLVELDEIEAPSVEYTLKVTIKRNKYKHLLDQMYNAGAINVEFVKGETIEIDEFDIPF